MVGKLGRGTLIAVACSVMAAAIVGLLGAARIGPRSQAGPLTAETGGPTRPIHSRAPIAPSAASDQRLLVHPDAIRAATSTTADGSARRASSVRPPASDGAITQPTPSVAPPRLKTDKAWQHHGLVAHAFGSTLDRTIYTNSEEAIRLSHNYGFRVFEVDMMLTKDRKVALVHDEFEGRYGLSREKTFSGYTQAQMEGKRFDGKYPMLFGDDLIRLMNLFPETYFVLDTKGAHVEIAEWLVRHMKPVMLDRLRPHVHSQEQIDGLRALYDWKGMVIATYKMGTGIQAKALELAVANGINTVMIRGSEYSAAMREQLASQGVDYVFIHDARNEAEARRYRSMGLGVYTHYWPLGA